MATAETPFPYEQGLDDFNRIVAAAQREIALQVRQAVLSGDLARASQRRLQLARVIATLDQLGAYVDPAARKLVADAYQQGAGRALDQIHGARIVAPEIPGAFAGVSIEAVAALQRSIVGSLQASRDTIGRQVDDLYAREGRRAALRAVLGADGSPQAARRQLAARLRQQGLTGFVDKAGREWKLDTYSQMVVRTVTREAVVQGSLARMASHGISLARVSFHATSCPVCKPFEDRLVSLDGNVAEYQGEAVMNTGEVPPYHPNCLAAGTEVATRGRYAGFRAPYSGDLVHMTTASGVRLAVTPNHPVMTLAGWLPAGELREGDHVLRGIGRNDPAASSDQHYFDDVPTPVEEVFDALASARCHALIAATGDDFHGDAIRFEGEVDVVLADDVLLDILAAQVIEQRCEQALVRPDSRQRFGVTRRPSCEGCGRVLAPARGRVSGVRRRRTDGDTGGSQALSHRGRRDVRIEGERVESFAREVAHRVSVDVLDLDGTRGRHAQLLAWRADVNARLFELGANARRARAEVARQVTEGEARGVQPDQLVTVDRRAYSGHVYDLSVRDGHYLANGLIVSNCAHSLQPVAVRVDEIRRELATSANG